MNPGFGKCVTRAQFLEYRARKQLAQSIARAHCAIQHRHFLELKARRLALRQETAREVQGRLMERRRERRNTRHPFHPLNEIQIHTPHRHLNNQVKLPSPELPSELLHSFSALSI